MGFPNHPVAKSVRLPSYVTSLEGAVAKLSPKAKQAFYAAASRAPIARGTWNGCAFNAGGSEVGANIRSVTAAATAFDMNADDVSTFIQYWDSSSYSDDVEATKDLLFMLRQVGLFSSPASPSTEKRGTRIRESIRIYTSKETAEMEAFHELVADIEVEIPGEVEAAQILCGVS